MKHDPVTGCHGGRLLIDALVAQGCGTVFCVPGESYLAALDGLYDRDVQVIVCRQEGGAAFMAEAYGKATGQPGVCFVTRGPGATNASIGVHVAQQDSTPMILFVGMPATDTTGRDAFQEFDLTAVFGSLGKSAEVINSADRIPEIVSRAFHRAQSGRSGPVIVGLPEDVLSGAAVPRACSPAQIAQPGVRPDDLKRLQERLMAAQRPLMIVGGPGWDTEVQTSIEGFCARFNLPVMCAFRFQDYIDNRHDCYAGHAGIGKHPAMQKMIRTADLIITLGARLGEMTSDGYSLFDIPDPEQTLVHIHPDPDELGAVYRADLPIASSAAAFAAAVGHMKPASAVPWSAWCQAARDAYLDSLKPVESAGSVKLEQIISQLKEDVPETTILTNGAGNCMGFLHRYYQYPGYRTAIAPTAGAMGYGVPAAIGAKIAFPNRPVIAFCGDGDFLMTGQELATAVQYSIDMVIVICNNSMYGTIRMHQERDYPGRVVATSLTNPDFAAYAKSFGAHGERVEETVQFRPALKRALATAGPSVIELVIDPEAITTSQTLTGLREAAFAKATS